MPPLDAEQGPSPSPSLWSAASMGVVTLTPSPQAVRARRITCIARPTCGRASQDEGPLSARVHSKAGVSSSGVWQVHLLWYSRVRGDSVLDSCLGMHLHSQCQSVLSSRKSAHHGRAHVYVVCSFEAQSEGACPASFCTGRLLKGTPLFSSTGHMGVVEGCLIQLP